MEHIIDQSGIIELYRRCHENIEDNFEISQRTVQHTATDMDADILKMALDLTADGIHVGTSHKVGKVVDQLAQGCELLSSKKSWLVSDAEDAEGVDEDVDAYEVEGTDLVT